MMAGYGQFGITVVQKAPPHPTGIGLEVITAQAILYDYFPDTCRAGRSRKRLRSEEWE